MQPGSLILLVDDNDNDLALFKAAVSKAGLDLTLVGTGNGQQAIDYLQRVRDSDRRPNIIVLDLRMPLKDGFDFLAWHKSSRYASIPVVVFTGWGDRTERQRALSSGADLVLEKPLKFDQLVDVVRTIGILGSAATSKRESAVLIS